MLYEVKMFDKEPKVENPNRCFLAGGINNVRDWQREVIDALKRSYNNDDLQDYIIYNPRELSENITEKEKYDIPDFIKWDDEHILKSDMLVFYFCKEATQITSVFELGRYITLRQSKYSDYSFPYKNLICFEEGYPYADKIKEYLKIMLGTQYYLTVTDKYISPDDIAKIIYQNVLFKASDLPFWSNN